MLKLIKKVLKTGPATVAYPAQPLAIDPNFRGKPEYSPQQCIACGACANACPSNALSMTPDLNSGTLRWQLFLGRCIFCARCEEVCPTAASSNWQCGVKRICTNKPTSPFVIADSAANPMRRKRKLIMRWRCWG